MDASELQLTDVVRPTTGYMNMDITEEERSSVNKINAFLTENGKVAWPIEDVVPRLRNAKNDYHNVALELLTAPSSEQPEQWKQVTRKKPNSQSEESRVPPTRFKSKRFNASNGRHSGDNTHGERNHTTSHSTANSRYHHGHGADGSTRLNPSKSRHPSHAVTSSYQSSQSDDSAASGHSEDSREGVTRGQHPSTTKYFGGSSTPGTVVATESVSKSAGVTTPSTSTIATEATSVTTSLSSSNTLPLANALASTTISSTTTDDSYLMTSSTSTTTAQESIRSWSHVVAGDRKITSAASPILTSNSPSLSVTTGSTNAIESLACDSAGAQQKATGLSLATNTSSTIFAMSNDVASVILSQSAKLSSTPSPPVATTLSTSASPSSSITTSTPTSDQGEESSLLTDVTVIGQEQTGDFSNSSESIGSTSLLPIANKVVMPPGFMANEPMSTGSSRRGFVSKLSTQSTSRPVSTTTQSVPTTAATTNPSSQLLQSNSAHTNATSFSSNYTSSPSRSSPPTSSGSTLLNTPESVESTANVLNPLVPSAANLATTALNISTTPQAMFTPYTYPAPPFVMSHFISPLMYEGNEHARSMVPHHYWGEPSMIMWSPAAAASSPNNMTNPNATFAHPYALASTNFSNMSASGARIPPTSNGANSTSVSNVNDKNSVSSTTPTTTSTTNTVTASSGKNLSNNNTMTTNVASQVVTPSYPSHLHLPSLQPGPALNPSLSPTLSPHHHQQPHLMPFASYPPGMLVASGTGNVGGYHSPPPAPVTLGPSNVLYPTTNNVPPMHYHTSANSSNNVHPSVMASNNIATNTHGIGNHNASYPYTRTPFLPANALPYKPDLYTPYEDEWTLKQPQLSAHDASTNHHMHHHAQALQASSPQQSHHHHSSQHPQSLHHYMHHSSHAPPDSTPHHYAQSSPAPHSQPFLYHHNATPHHQNTYPTYLHQPMLSQTPPMSNSTNNSNSANSSLSNASTMAHGQIATQGNSSSQAQPAVANSASSSVSPTSISHQHRAPSMHLSHSKNDTQLSDKLNSSSNNANMSNKVLEENGHHLHHAHHHHIGTSPSSSGASHLHVNPNNTINSNGASGNNDSNTHHYLPSGTTPNPYYPPYLYKPLRNMPNLSRNMPSSVESNLNN